MLFDHSIIFGDLFKCLCVILLSNYRLSNADLDNNQYDIMTRFNEYVK